MYGCLTHEDTHLGGHFQDMNPSNVRKLSQYTKKHRKSGYSLLKKPEIPRFLNTPTLSTLSEKY